AFAVFLTWYHVDRSYHSEIRGWDTFPRLRIVMLAATAVTLVTALIRQTRLVLAIRTVTGVGVAILVVRHIVENRGADVHTRAGGYIAFVAAVAVAVGGL